MNISLVMIAYWPKIKQKISANVAKGCFELRDGVVMVQKTKFWSNSVIWDCLPYINVNISSHFSTFMTKDGWRTCSRSVKYFWNKLTSRRNTAVMKEFIIYSDYSLQNLTKIYWRNIKHTMQSNFNIINVSIIQDSIFQSCCTEIHEHIKAWICSLIKLNYLFIYFWTL